MTVMTMTLLPCLTERVQIFCMPEKDAASPIPLTSVLVMPWMGIVMRAQDDAGRITMFMLCGVPFHQQPVVPTAEDETELPRTWAISCVVTSWQGSAALAGRCGVNKKTDAATMVKSRTDSFMGTSLASRILALRK